MSLIRSIRPATAAEWDQLWLDCPYATYFHSRPWAQTWEEYSDGHIKPAPRMVEFRDGGRALLPLSVGRRFRGLDPIYISSPAGTYGGWLAEAALDEAHASAMRSLLAKQLGNVVWRLNPFDPSAVAAPAGAEPDETHVLNLEGGFEPLRAAWEHRQGRSVRRAQREGVTIRVASSEADWRAYFELYQRALQRWGDHARSRYDWRLFQILFQLADPNVKLWLAEHAGQVVAGDLLLYSPRFVCDWHGAADAESFGLKPVNLLDCSAIQDACQRGFKWFDFGPSGGLAGVAAFKRSFGSQPLSSPMVQVQTARSAWLHATWSALKRPWWRATTFRDPAPAGSNPAEGPGRDRSGEQAAKPANPAVELATDPSRLGSPSLSAPKITV